MKIYLISLLLLLGGVLAQTPTDDSGDAPTSTAKPAPTFRANSGGRAELHYMALGGSGLILAAAAAAV